MAISVFFDSLQDTREMFMSSAECAGDDGIRLLYSLSKEELIKIIVDDAKNWLAHDGVWFQAVERRYGMEAAVDVDTEAWRSFYGH